MPALGMERVTLGVVCQLEEKRYLQNLRDVELAAIETACAERLSTALNNSLSFLNFSPDNNHRQRLVIKLGKNDSAVRAVDFALSVEGDTVQGAADPVIWPFRTVEDWLKIPIAATFPDEIQIQFAASLNADSDRLVSTQLSRVAIARFACGAGGVSVVIGLRRVGYGWAVVGVVECTVRVTVSSNQEVRRL